MPSLARLAHQVFDPRVGLGVRGRSAACDRRRRGARWGSELALRPGDVLVDGGFGTRIPGETEVLTPETLIVPLAAFDAEGYRLGYGGGFYDRTLAKLRAEGTVMAIGFAYGCQEVARVPREATDQRLDMIVTEAGARHI